MDAIDTLSEPELPDDTGNDGFGGTPDGETKLFFLDLVKFTLIAFVIVAPIRYFIAQPFIVNGSSMDPTFANGDYLVVDQLSYRIEEPKRGDVVIFRYPLDTSKFFIKRIIGLPQEAVKVDGNRVTVTNPVSKETIELAEPYLRFIGPSYVNVRLEADEYFVMGDNRPASSDSRSWGAVPRSNIIGSAFLRLFPFDKVDVRPGAVDSIGTTPEQ